MCVCFPRKQCAFAIITSTGRGVAAAVFDRDERCAPARLPLPPQLPVDRGGDAIPPYTVLERYPSETPDSQSIGVVSFLNVSLKRENNPNEIKLYSFDTIVTFLFLFFEY